MPIEIKELIIRAVVENDPSHRAAAGPPIDRDEDRAALIQACVDQTLRILKRRKER